MTTDNNNPFVLPGFGQSGESGRNPLLASMEMMRQAWQGLAGSGTAASPMAPPATLEEMDRRIADLRTVENWLRINLSMLTSTIQGLEVQRATLGTLKSFMDAATGAGASAQAPGPSRGPAAGSAKSSAAGAADAPAAAQAWWNMLQKQFDTLAAATTATMQGAKTMKEGVSPAKTATSDETPAKAAPRKRAAKKHS